MSFDPITLNQLQKTLVNDKAIITRFEAGVAVNTDASFTVIKDEAGPKRGHLVGLVVNQQTLGNRVPDEIRITIDGTVGTYTGLDGGAGGAPFFTQASNNAYPIVIPLRDRFKSSFKVEVKGNASTGTFEVALIWAEEI
jgi:hypothetical protein